MSYYYENDNEYDEIEQQIMEEEYFDQCWDLHSGLIEYLDENCIPIMQKCDFSSFYELCKHGKRYIVDLEQKEKLQEQRRLNFLQNLNKPFPKIINSSKTWITLGKKKKTIANPKTLGKKELKEELNEEEISGKKNELSKFNWTKKKKKNNN